ncbi:hypothetical protein [Helicobacter sp. T3_23-1059]
MQIQKHLKPKKIILALFIAWIIYLIGIPLYYTPYALQPSYWEFKKLCQLNLESKSREKYSKILTYFNAKLGDKDESVKKWIQYTNRIRLRLNIYYNDSQHKVLTYENIFELYLAVDWQSYNMDIFGNEGNMEFELIFFDREMTCVDL